MQECYILKEVDEQTQDTLNLEIGKAIMTVSMLEEQMKQEIILHVNNLAKNQGGEINDNVNFEKYLDKDLFEIAKGMPNEQLEAIIDIINLKYNEMPDIVNEYMIKINEIKLPLDSNESALRTAAAKALRCKEDKIKSLQITKKAVDSRKKDNIYYISG